MDATSKAGSKHDNDISDDERARRQKLEDSRNDLPPFLFRGFSRSSGSKPGSAAEEPALLALLNNTNSIRPRASLQGKMDRTLHDMACPGQAILDHLDEDCTDTQFSSWTASLEYASMYMERRSYMGQKDPPWTQYIAVLDTRRLSKDVGVYYSPLLDDCFGVGKCDPREYLVHGVVEGEALVVASRHVLEEGGLWVGDRQLPLTLEGMAAGAKQVAMSVADRWAARYPHAPPRHDLVMWLTASLLGVWRYEHGQPAGEEVEVIARALGEEPGVMVPEEWRTLTAVVGGGVFCDLSEDLGWAVGLVRRLLERRGE